MLYWSKTADFIIGPKSAQLRISLYSYLKGFKISGVSIVDDVLIVDLKKVSLQNAKTSALQIQ